MRTLSLFVLSFTLAACAEMNIGAHQPVDVAHLPPLSGQEQALLISADTAAATGDSASAERNYQTAIAKSQGHVEAHLGLANLYLRQQKPEKAKEILLKAAELQPNHPEVNHLLGKLAIEAGDPAAAAVAYERGLNGDPGNIDLLTGDGVAHDMLHKHKAAQLLYLRAIGLHPSADLAATKTNLAMSYLLDNEPKKAIALLKPEMKKPNPSPVMRDNLALAYGLAGRHVEARVLLKGTMSEDERLASLQRLKKYIADEANPPRKPAEPAEPPSVQSVPVNLPAEPVPVRSRDAHH